MLTEPYDDSVTDVTKAEAYADSRFLSDLLSIVVCSLCLFMCVCVCVCIISHLMALKFIHSVVTFT